MTKAELRDHYAGVRRESKKEARRLRVISKMIEEQMDVARKASQMRKWAKWGYLYRIVEDKIMGLEVVIKTYRIRRKRPKSAA